MFLIGPPGPEKFRIAHLFAQLVNQEVEYQALSRDTTESDLKQRREIRNGTAFFEDQVLFDRTGLYTLFDKYYYNNIYTIFNRLLLKLLLMGEF